MKSLQPNSNADPLLYRTYWRLCLEDVLHYLGFDPTPSNKHVLHEFHKRVLGYNSTAGRSQEAMSRFISEVTIFWAVEKGIFVRTSRRQPLGIEMMGFSDEVEVNGKKKKVWDLL